MATEAADKRDQIIKQHGFDDIAHDPKPVEAPNNILFIRPGHDNHRQCRESGIHAQFTQKRQARPAWQVKIEHDEIRKIVGLLPGWVPKTYQGVFRSVLHINARSWRLWLRFKLLPGEHQGLAKQLCFTRTVFQKKDSPRFPRPRGWLRCIHVVRLGVVHRTLYLARGRGNRQQGIKTSRASHDKIAHPRQNDTVPRVFSDACAALTIMLLLPPSMSSIMSSFAR